MNRNAASVTRGIERRLATAVFLIAVILATVKTGRAAQLISPPEGSDCRIELQGELAPGDDKLFGEEVLSREMKLLGGSGYALCLDSIGGSFDAALKIADQLIGRNLPTLVLSGQRCLSACALIFMAGTDSDLHGTSSSRQLVLGGELGFHAPYLFAPRGNYDEASIDLAYLTATQQVGRLVRFAMHSFEGKSLLPSVLLEGMLATKKDSMIHIDTVMAAILAQIDITFPKTMIASVKSPYRNACDNFISSIFVVGHLTWLNEPATWSNAPAIFKSVSSAHTTEYMKIGDRNKYYMFVGYPDSENSGGAAVDGCFLVDNTYSGEGEYSVMWVKHEVKFASQEVKDADKTNYERFSALVSRVESEETSESEETYLGDSIFLDEWYVMPYDAKIN